MARAEVLGVDVRELREGPVTGQESGAELWSLEDDSGEKPRGRTC